METPITTPEPNNSNDMAKDPAFLFFPGDWLGGTMTFSRSHKGAYMDLLMCQFNQGHMALQDIQIVLGETDFNTMWENKLKSKFIQDGSGLYYNQKLEDETIKRRNFTKSRTDNLNSSSHKEHHMGNHKSDHKTSLMEYGNRDGDDNTNDNGIKPLNIPFNVFWNLYDKKVGDRDKLEKKWASFKPADRVKIMEYIPRYIRAQPDKKYRKNPSTFFNNKSWNDELIYSKNNINGTYLKGHQSTTAGGQDPTRIAREGIGEL